MVKERSEKRVFSFRSEKVIECQGIKKKKFNKQENQTSNFMEIKYQPNMVKWIEKDLYKIKRLYKINKEG